MSTKRSTPKPRTKPRTKVPPLPQRGLLSPAQRKEVLQLVRKGMTYLAVAQKFDITKERVRQIVTSLDPKLVEKRRAARVRKISTPRPKFCAVHPDRKLIYPQKRYCSKSCAEAVRVLKELTEYRLGHLRAVARREGRDGITMRALQRQILHKDSKAYRMLEEHGLLKKLPKHVEIV